MGKRGAQGRCIPMYTIKREVKARDASGEFSVRESGKAFISLAGVCNVEVLQLRCLRERSAYITFFILSFFLCSGEVGFLIVELILFFSNGVTGVICLLKKYLRLDRRRLCQEVMFDSLDCPVMGRLLLSCNFGDTGYWMI